MKAPRAINANALLIASAIALPVLIGVQASRTGLVGEAHANVVGQAGGTTALTATAGSQDVLVVLDGRSEELLVYRVENQSSVELYQRLSVPRLFAEARGKSGITRPSSSGPVSR